MVVPYKEALLVGLTVGVWQGQKVDKEVSEEINLQKQAALNAGRFRKQLVTRESLKPLLKVATDLRALHRHYTLGWVTEALRLLPSSAYTEYQDALREKIKLFQELRTSFLNEYDVERSAARQRLGDLYRDSDYPVVSDISEKFYVEIEVLPVAEPALLNQISKLSLYQKDRLQFQVEAQYAKKFEEARRAALSNILTVLDAIGDMLLKDNPKIYQATFEKLERVCGLATHYSELFKDELYQELEREIFRDVLSWSVDDLRTDKGLQARVGKLAKEIISKYEDLYVQEQRRAA